MRKGPDGQIVLHDGLLAVLGWERWREIDNRHFGGRFATALARAMDEATRADFGCSGHMRHLA
jgi:hypothetical protein